MRRRGQVQGGWLAARRLTSLACLRLDPALTPLLVATPEGLIVTVEALIVNDV